LPNPRRKKGDRFERELVAKLQKAGIPALRVPMSGGGSIPGDVLYGPNHRYRAEAKKRAGGEGWKTLERWLAGNESLILGRDRADPLVVLDWGTFTELMGYVMECEGVWDRLFAEVGKEFEKRLGPNYGDWVDLEDVENAIERVREGQDDQ